MRNMSAIPPTLDIRILVCVFVLAGLSAPALKAQTEWPTKGWPSSTPSEVALDPVAIHELDAEIEGGKYGYIDGMLIIRHGKVVFDRSYPHDYDRIYSAEVVKLGALNAHDPTGPYNYFNPWWHPFYRRGDLHSLQSVTKTVTSVVIGVATALRDFPSLDTPVLSFFDPSKVANVDDRKRRLNHPPSPDDDGWHGLERRPAVRRSEQLGQHHGGEL